MKVEMLVLGTQEGKNMTFASAMAHAALICGDDQKTGYWYKSFLK